MLLGIITYSTMSCLSAYRMHPYRCVRPCSWIRKHAGSITALRLCHLADATAANGLRESCALVMFGMLAKSLKSLAIDNCQHVRDLFPVACFDPKNFGRMLRVLTCVKDIYLLTVRVTRSEAGVSSVQILPSQQLAAVAVLRQLRCLHLHLHQTVCLHWHHLRVLGFVGIGTIASACIPWSHPCKTAHVGWIAHGQRRWQQAAESAERPVWSQHGIEFLCAHADLVPAAGRWPGAPNPFARAAADHQGECSVLYTCATERWTDTRVVGLLYALT